MYTPTHTHTHTLTEPGYYEDGKFGIRIENVVVIVPTETKYGSGYLTMEPVTLVCGVCVCVCVWERDYSLCTGAYSAEDAWAKPPDSWWGEVP